MIDRDIFQKLLSVSLNFKFTVHLTDDTTSMGKQTCREKDETSFEVAIEALTYLSPVTRDAIRKS